MVGFSPTRRFSPGRLTATDEALKAIRIDGRRSLQFLVRHEEGDWGDLPRGGQLANEEALRTGG